MFWCHMKFGELWGRQGLRAQGQGVGSFQESSSIEKYLLNSDLKQQSKQSQGKAVGLEYRQDSKCRDLRMQPGQACLGQEGEVCTGVKRAA